MPKPPGDTLLVRGIGPEVASRLRRASAGREMTLAQYLTHLLDLHDAIRARADAGDDALAAELEARGLGTIRA